ncbi:RAxF-45 family protein [Lentibacillus sp. Marseille-P4043]|nr:RAxF-45 family protein [Lentibacillus sp. Marseille-P4043]
MIRTGSGISKFKEYLWMRYAIFSNISVQGTSMHFFNKNIWKKYQ